MAGKGRWSLQFTHRNCGRCKACMGNPGSRPHGPYVHLRRRNPADSGRKGKQDTLYLGRIDMTGEQLAIINRRFTGPDVPTREEVLGVIGGPVEKVF